ncbi:uncharacterized protein LOC117579782 [Drosophila guanche]|uniref:Uncharacterized protein n=1 Tax=Drosophila guanche TaxID=7266 RepID=A0A3B0J4F0_DROGU|nr:uncharacterized protein LOC117579782 [Drosophila guanche]XP_034121733.1 uncharacterized protein LOC117579782 [Drosophila guanche]SPP76694.1 Hypothetical predicted protein [Drosophila guanche]
MGTDKKKPPKKPSPKKEPKKKESPTKSKDNKKKLPSNPLIAAIEKNLLKICYFIAITDLIHALYFAVQATMLLVVRFHLISSLALAGAIFWVLVVILLLVGLWKRRPAFVRAWILFSAVGFVVDILFLIWGITSSITVDWDHLQEFTIIFIGILVEFTCLYFIYRYYLLMAGTGKKGAEKGCCKSGGSQKSTDRKRSGSERKKPDDKKKAQEKKDKEKKKAQEKKKAEDKKKAEAKKKAKK